MATCTFFGHGECCNLDIRALQDAIEERIGQGVDTFYVGHQGRFDSLVFGHLKRLQAIYPHIRVWVVLAYLPIENGGDDPYRGYSVYPEIEGHPKFAIARRNRWMIDRSDCCVCYVTHPWGGAFKFARQAKRKGLAVLNLGDVAL